MTKDELYDALIECIEKDEEEYLDNLDLFLEYLNFEVIENIVKAKHKGAN